MRVPIRRPQRFDCSGFVYWVWHNGDRAAEASLNVPDGRTTYTMNVGKRA